VRIGLKTTRKPTFYLRIMTKTKTQEIILELKNQLSEIPETEEFRQKREKLESKITSYEIMSTPAANDFLNKILEEKKQLLPEQGIFSFAQILAREQADALKQTQE
jgi:predicted flap endonuclease-1-like 5' DNA nuclease